MKTWQPVLIFVASATLNGFLRRHQFRRHQRAGAATTSLPMPPRPPRQRTGAAFVSLHRRVGLSQSGPDHVRRPRRQGVLDLFHSDQERGRHVAGAGDATMLSNGNIVFCRKVGASEVTPDKKIIWNMDAPKGTEIHSIQPIGLDHVLVTINGNPAGKLLLINTTTGKTEKEYTFPVLNPEANPHIQFRRVRETKDGTFLAAHLRIKKSWNMTRTSKKSGPTHAVIRGGRRGLKNGNTLISSDDHSVLEVNKQGKIVWQFTPGGRAGYKLSFSGGEPSCQRQHRDLQLVSAQPGPEVLARHGAGAGSDAGEKKLSGR